jgi:Protein of unknown function (DUF1186)
MGTYSAPVDKLLTFRLLDPRVGLEDTDFIKEFGLSTENIPDLIRLATDPDLLKDDDTEFTEEDNLAFAGTVYALVILKQLKAEEAIEPLLTLFKDYPNNEWAMEELVWFYAAIGAKAIPILAHFISEWTSNDDSKGYSIEALGKIGVDHPETRLEVIQALISLLKGEENREANGAIVGQLAALKAVEAADEVKQAFEEDKVDESYAGDWEEFQFYVGLREPTEEENRRRSSPFSGFSSSNPFEWPSLPLSSSNSAAYLPKPAQKAAPTKKKKDKQARASRKQNRRKK